MRGAKPSTDLATIFPGRKVPITGPGGTFVATVRPMPFWALNDYSERLARAYARAVAAGFNLAALFDENWDPKPDFESKARPMIPGLIPIVLGELLSLVNDSVEGLDLEAPGLAHWAGPPIVAAWFEETFSDPTALRTWAEALKTVTSVLSGLRNRPGSISGT